MEPSVRTPSTSSRSSSMHRARSARESRCFILRTQPIRQAERGAELDGGLRRFEADEVGYVDHADGAILAVHHGQFADLPGAEHLQGLGDSGRGSNDERLV